MRHKRTSIAAAVVGVVGWSTASACTCALLDAPEILERTPVVFFAEVVEVGPETLNVTYHGTPAKGSRVVLGAVESFKGQAPRELVQSGREFSCHPELKEGGRALFLLFKPNEAIGLCNTVQGREDLLPELRKAVGRKQ